MLKDKYYYYKYYYSTVQSIVQSITKFSVILI